MANYISFIMLFLIGSFISQVGSSCMRAGLVSQLTKHGNVDQHCVYKNIKVLPGSSFNISAPDCLECKCTTQGLHCCGFGFAAGVVVPPEGCVAYNDACHLIFVKKDTPSEICHRPKSVNKGKKNRKLSGNRQA